MVFAPFLADLASVWCTWCRELSTNQILSATHGFL